MLKNFGLFTVIIGDLVGCVGAGVGIGYFAMKKWNAPWWVLLLSSVTGLTVAMYRMYLASEKLN